MKTGNINFYDSKPSFNAKVSQHFIDTAHNFYNFGIRENKKKNIYLFNQKAEEFGKFGFNDFTIDYERKLVDGNYNHYLVAEKSTGYKAMLYCGNTLKSVINRFMTMNKNGLRNGLKNKYIPPKSRQI